METAFPLQWAMGGVFTTLLAATATTTTLRRIRPRLNLDEVRLRIRSWWVMAAVFVVAVAVHPTVTLGFLAAVGIAAMWELARTTKTVVFPIAVASTALAYLAGFAGRQDLLLLAVIVAPAVAAIGLVVQGKPDRFVARVGGTAVATAVGGGLAHLAAVLALPATGSATSGGAGMLLWLVIVAQGGDVAQFLSGKALGRRKLAPAVSPNKTVAGFVGGAAVAAILGGTLGVLLTGNSWLWGGFLGAAVAVAGTLGDLIVSAIKRDCGVKDAGTLIPGHGGVLDRVDSLVLAAPLVFMVVAA